MSKSGFFWNDRESRFSLILEQRFINTSSRPIVTEKISQNCMESSSHKEVRINRSLAEDEQFRRDQQLLHVQLLEQNRELREAHEKSLNEMEELKRFQGSTFDGFCKKKIDRRSRHYP